jgi:hypothetical protein
MQHSWAQPSSLKEELHLGLRLSVLSTDYEDVVGVRYRGLDGGRALGSLFQQIDGVGQLMTDLLYGPGKVRQVLWPVRGRNVEKKVFDCLEVPVIIALSAEYIPQRGI